MTLRFAVSSVVVAIAAASPSASQDHRDLAAHVHGEAELGAAVDGDWLIVELRSPLVNFVGFEHAPSNDAERAALEAALDDVSMGTGLVVPNEAAGCRLARVSAEGPGFEGDHGDGHGAHDHAEPAGHAHTEGHAEIAATYAFECARVGALSEIALPLFQSYPGVDTIAATFIGEDAQVFRRLASGEAFRLAD